jgi:hypothetical protein
MPMRLNANLLGKIVKDAADIKSVSNEQSPTEMTFTYTDKETKEDKQITGAEDFARMIMAEGATASDFDKNSLLALAKILNPEVYEELSAEQLFETLRFELEDWYNLSANEILLNE